MKLTNININDIERIFPFSVRFGLYKGLMDSIKEFGILQPVIAYKIGTRYVIVSGKGRFKAALKLKHKLLPCYVIKKDNEKSLLIQNLKNDLIISSSYTALEKANVLDLSLKYGFSTEEKRCVFQLLKIPFSKNSNNLLETILESKTTVKKWIFDKNPPLSLLSFLTELSKDDMEILVKKIFLPLKTNINETSAISMMIRDISIRDKVKIKELVENFISKEINRKDAIRKLTIRLFKLRYPLYSKFLKDINKKIKDMDIPSFLNLDISRDGSKKITLITNLESKKSIKELLTWLEKNKQHLLSFFDERYF